MRSICFVIPSLNVGGAERSLVKLANAVVANGQVISIAVLSGDASQGLIDELDSSVRIEMLHGDRSGNPLLWLRLASCLRRVNPDVVFGWSLFANLMVCVLRLLRLVAQPVCISERNYLPDVLRRSTPLRRVIVWRLVRTLYPVADVITANSAVNVKFMRRFLGPVAGFSLLPNSIDITNIDRQARRPGDAIARDTSPRILAVGRLRFQKGFDVLLRAFRVVCDSHDWHLVVVGEGPERQSLASLASALEIDNAITWLGEQKNPFPFYRWAELVVVPSRYEGFPNVPLEAMASGCAVICANCRTGPLELTAAGKYGRLVPVEDVNALADAIICLGEDAEARQRLGEAARRRVTEQYNVTRVAATFAAIIKSLG